MYKSIAKDKLNGKWGNVVILTLIYFAVILVADRVISMIFKAGFLQNIVSFIIETPLQIGLIFVFYKIYREEDVSYFDFIKLGFNNFVKVISILVNIFLRLIIPYIITVVSMILLFIMFITGKKALVAILGLIALGFTIYLVVRSFDFVLCYFILAENEDLTASEIVENSKELMQNRKMEFFVLQISFIGWAILALLSLGIGMLWLMPYMIFSSIAFYENAKEN